MNRGFATTTQEFTAAEISELIQAPGTWYRFRPKISSDIVVLGLILAALQVLDGLLTAIGVSHLGTSAEGNMLIRHLMEAWGYGPALIAIKSLALMIVALLCFLATSVSWVRFAMKGVIALYLLAAIIPWSTIILTRLV